MTCDTETAMPPADCCKPAHYATSIRELNATMASLCRCSEQRALWPQTQCPHPSPTHSPRPLLYEEAQTVPVLPFSFCRIGCWFRSLSQLYYSKTLLRIYDICLSLYHSTNSSNKTGPEREREKKKDNVGLIRYAQLCRIFWRRHAVTHRHRPHRSCWGLDWLSYWTLKHCTTGLCWWLYTWTADEKETCYTRLLCCTNPTFPHAAEDMCQYCVLNTSKNWLKTGNRGHVFPRRSPSMHLAVFKSKLLWSFSCSQKKQLSKIRPHNIVLHNILPTVLKKSVWT